MKLAYNTIVVPKGAEFDLVLADGTQVWLNADSKSKYQKLASGEGSTKWNWKEKDI